MPAADNFRKLKPVLAFVRPYRARVALACVAILFTSLSVLGLGGALRYMVDHGFGNADITALNHAYQLLLGVSVLLAAASYARYSLVAWLGERVVADIRNAVYRKLVAMDVAFFEMTKTGEILSRLTTDTTLLQTLISTSVSVSLRNILMMAGGLTLLFITSPRLTAYVLIILPVVVVPILLLGRRVRIMSRDAQSRVAGLNAQAEETVSAIRTVHAYTMESAEGARFGHSVQEALDAALARIRFRAVLIALVILLVFGAVVTVLWIGGHDVMNGRLSAGELSAFVFYAVLVASSLGALSEAAVELQRAAGAAERLAELLSLAPAVSSPPTPLPMPTLSAGASIAFENVTFHYPSRPERAALADLTLRVAPGEVVALVGPSGAGKTTLFQLLLRFYDPASGTINLNDTDIRKLPLHDYRRTIGLVAQDPAIFSADASANIRFGRPEATDEEVREAARAAQALDFLEQLPQGLHTHLGEKGVRLSGGQRSRIAIARAIIRDPAILLLDEATSALDAENERLVQHALEKLMQNRTTLVIAHRLSTVVRANRIVLLNEGHIEAIGTHETLLKQSPLYARLAALQFALAA